MGLNVADGQSWQIATSPRRAGTYGATMSPQGRWMAIVTTGENVNGSLNLYDLDTRTAYPVSRGYADAQTPVFSKDGKTLFFTASTNAGSVYGGLDMTTQDRPYRAAVYAAVLEADGKSPLAPILADEEAPDKDKKAEGDEAKDGEETDKKADEDKKGVKVEPKGIARRIVALPMAEASYGSLATAKDGALFAVERPQPGEATGPGTGGERFSLIRFDFKERKAETVAPGITYVATDKDGDKLLLGNAGGQLMTSPAAKETRMPPAATG